jgi:hypothetical protein
MPADGTIRHLHRMVRVALQDAVVDGLITDKIQDILGRSSPTMTKLIYVEVTKQSQRSTADKLGYLFDA